MQEENNKIIVLEQDKLIYKVSNSLRIADKLLPIKEEPKLIPYRKVNKWGFCTHDKKIIIDCIYEDAYQFIENLAKVKQNNKYGYIDKSGNIIIPLIYDVASDFKDGYAIVSISGINGKINKTNHFVKIPNFRNKMKAFVRIHIDCEKSIKNIQDISTI